MEITPTFIRDGEEEKMSTIIVQHEFEMVEMTTIEKRLETCRNIWQLLKTEFNDLPKFRKSKMVIHSQKTCDSDMGSASAHCHHGNNQICYQQKFLMRASLESLASTTAHELAHTKIKSCRHCKKFYARHNQHWNFLQECKKNGKLQECWVETMQKKQRAKTILSSQAKSLIKIDKELKAKNELIKKHQTKIKRSETLIKKHEKRIKFLERRKSRLE